MKDLSDIKEIKELDFATEVNKLLKSPDWEILEIISINQRNPIPTQTLRISHGYSNETVNQMSDIAYESKIITKYILGKKR